MSEHKIPQDVEAEDKILGPFSFRQFIYLLISFMGGAAMFFLGKIALPLALISAPIFVFFAVLALPLKKDQPMEAYLGAMFRFLLLPKTRIWKQDIHEDMVEIAAPISDNTPQIKDIKGSELSQRLSFLAELEDTQGWSSLGATSSIGGNFQEDVMISENNVADIMDENSENSRIVERNLENSHNEIKQKMQQKIANQSSAQEPQNSPANQNSFFTPSAPDYNISANNSENSQNFTESSSANMMRQDFSSAPPSIEDENAAAELLKQSAVARPQFSQHLHERVISPFADAPEIDQKLPLESSDSAPENLSQNQNQNSPENNTQISANPPISANNFENLPVAPNNSQISQNNAEIQSENSPNFLNQTKNAKIVEMNNSPISGDGMEINLH